MMNYIFLRHQKLGPKNVNRESENLESDPKTGILKPKTKILYILLLRNKKRHKVTRISLPSYPNQSQNKMKSENIDIQETILSYFSQNSTHKSYAPSGALLTICFTSSSSSIDFIGTPELLHPPISCLN